MTIETTSEERKAWLDGLKPGDEVMHSEIFDGYGQNQTRATVTYKHRDCFVLGLSWPDGGSARLLIDRGGVRSTDFAEHRIDPMTEEARRRLVDGARRDWLKENIRTQVDNLSSDDLRRVADILGYKDGAK